MNKNPNRIDYLYGEEDHNGEKPIVENPFMWGVATGAFGVLLFEGLWLLVSYVVSLF